MSGSTLLKAFIMFSPQHLHYCGLPTLSQGGPTVGLIVGLQPTHSIHTPDVRCPTGTLPPPTCMACRPECISLTHMHKSYKPTVQLFMVTSVKSANKIFDILT